MSDKKFSSQKKTFMYRLCPGIVVHCGTYKEAHKFCNQCRRYGFLSNTKSFFEKVAFKIYGSRTAFFFIGNAGLQGGPLDFYKEHGYFIIEYSDIYRK